MFKNMKLATKLVSGFLCVVAIAILIGAVGIYNMNVVSHIATVMAEQYVPAANVANNVERSAFTTMYEARGYAYTDDTGFLNGARRNLAVTREQIQAATTLAADQDMEVLAGHAEAAGTAAIQYAQLLDQTVELTEGLGRVVSQSEEAAQQFVQTVGQYLATQEAALSSFLDESLASVDTLDTEERRQNVRNEVWIRHLRMKGANDILDEGNAVIQNTWRSIADRDPEHFRETMTRFDRINRMLDDLQQATRQEANLRLIANCRSAADNYLRCMTQFLEAWTAREALGAQRNAVATEVLDAAQKTAEYAMNGTTDGASQAARALIQATWIVVVGLSIGAAIGVFIAIFLTRAITKPINRIIAGLTEGSEQVAAASGQVSAASQSLAEGATEQAAGLEETSSSLEEMSSMTKQNADNAQQANALAGEARKAADTGAESMTRMSKAINDIQKSSDETAKIIKVIDEIAFQTNLLALNAAVEAARAGEAGKGFAVVAEEVRNLAMRSAEAAKNTASMIEESVKNAKNGVDIAAEVGKVLDEIVQSIGKTTDLVGEIAAASQEQAQGIDQVNTAVSQMDKVTQQNAANAEESASASEELSSQAESMNEIVGELTALVGGNRSKAHGAGRKKAPVHRLTTSHHDMAPAKGNRYGKSDEPFHHIATKTKTASRQAIPLGDDEDLDHFNN